MNTVELSNEILDFIHRRFCIDCNWKTGNCYYFALILKERFNKYKPKLFYDAIDGHFLCQINNVFYDWTGIANYPHEYALKYIKNWETLKNADELYYSHIVRDVIM